MESGLLLLKTAGALALVLGILFAFIYVLKRWGNPAKRPASQAMMEVLSKHSFGPRHHLMLVECGRGEQSAGRRFPSEHEPSARKRAGPVRQKRF